MTVVPSADRPDPGHVEARRRIAADLRELGVACEFGVAPGALLLVHSSLRSLGFVPGGAETVVDALLDAVGDAGTLLMPSLSYRAVNDVNPRFDLERTPSCVGLIPETFRTRPGVLRSAHPTHSVAGIGPRAEEALARHHLDETPCGPGSPYRWMRDRDAHVLFLGCGMRPNTSMHGVEELVEPPYLFRRTITYTMILADGTRRSQRCRRHDFAGYAQRYERIADRLAPGDLAVGRVLGATAHLVRCAPMWGRAEEWLRADPFALVEPIPAPSEA